MKQQWIKIFNAPYEAINLSIGFAFLTASLIQIFFFKSWAGTGSQTFHLISSWLFFNGLHVMTTFVNCLMVKEYRTLFKKKFQIKYLGFLALLLFGIFLAHKLNLFENNLFTGFVIHLLLLAPVYHATRQTQGLSLLYNRKLLDQLQHKNVWSTLVSKSIKLEKMATGVNIIGFYFTGVGLLEPKYRFYIDKNFLSFTGSGLICLSIFLLVFSIVRIKKSQFVYPKLVFHLRTLARASVLFSKFGIFLGAAIHGSEYLMLQLSLEKRMSRKIVMGIWMVSIPLFILKAIFDFPQLGFDLLGFSRSNVSIQVLAAIGASLPYVHYYMDSVLFKMSDPVVRGTIGDFLIQNHQSSIPVQKTA